MNPIAVALDVPDLGEAVDLATRIGDAAGVFKVGLELCLAEGPSAVAAAFEDLPVFADLKLHDIPTTVARSLRALARHRFDYINVHALGGAAMMEAASQEKGDTALLAVTILTSLDDDALSAVGLPPAAEAVPILAGLARDSGCDGVVCAPTDIAAVRAVCPSPFLIVTPGVRPEGADRGDQVRVATPAGARGAGADLLVIGRPITRAPDPRLAALEIMKGLG